MWKKYHLWDPVLNGKILLQEILRRTNSPTFPTYVIVCNGCHSNIC
jgi:hypothetical protein